MPDIFKKDEPTNDIKINNIDYGDVKKYISTRGFGFVAGNLNENAKSISKDVEVFFHIKTIKKTDFNLSRKLQNEEENIFFWYEIEYTKKGKQVTKILNFNQFTEEQLSYLSIKLNDKWLDISKEIPSWLKQASKDILTSKEINILQQKRRLLINERAEQKQLEKLHKERKAKECQKKTIEREFQQLVDEMKSFNFSNSSDVSNYILKNKLGYKYKTISGELEMHKNGESWKFKGGFSPDIYARLCSELGLSNNGSNATAGKFESFRSLNDW